MIRVLAPASTANLGPGFDAAAAALDLWNEVVVEDGSFAVVVDGEGADESPRDKTHLALRAFALVAPLEGHSFRFTNRIPFDRGLGSSAAAIALGLLAGAVVSGSTLTPDELLSRGLELEQHADNLAAALNGGVCLAWRDETVHAVRVAVQLPLAVILVVPAERTVTATSRNGLPATVSHEDAAASAGAAALLGAAIAAGDAELLRAAFRDRLHEPYRLENAPLLRLLREELPAAAGVTLSGSGPSVVVWAEPAQAADVAARIAQIVPADTKVLPLRVAREGAHVT